MRRARDSATSFFDLEPGKFGIRRRVSILAGFRRLPSGETWRGNLQENRRFLVPGTYADGAWQSPLSCRNAWLGTFAYRLFRESEIRLTPAFEWEYVYTRPVAGDSLLASMGCTEFTAQDRFHALEVLPGKDSARWMPTAPRYSVAVNPSRTFCGEDLLLDFSIHGEATPPWVAHGLVQISGESMDPTPFPFRVLHPVERQGPAPSLELQNQTWTVEWQGFDSTRFRKIQVRKTLEASGTSEFRRAAVVEASLVYSDKDGNSLELVASRRGAQDNLDEAAISAVTVTDLDLDGHPDFIVSGEFIGTLVIFLDGDGIRDSVILRIDQSASGC